MKRLANTLVSPVFQSCALALLLVAYFYGDILFNPGSYLFSVSPDGIKGYYTYAWQIRYGETPFEFTGMNYPNGEHMLFTDGHTLFVLLSWCFPFLANYPVETINLCMLLSIVVTAGVMCALLREWGAQHTFAVTGALIITFCMPQLMRMTGHFSLSYGFVIPLGMLWWTRWIKTEKHFMYAWRIALLLLGVLFLHIYLPIMLVMFLGFSSLVVALLKRDIRFNLKYWACVSFAILVPVFLFRLLMWYTDVHVNRSENPTGFFEYHSAWKGIFLPVTGYFSSWAKTYEALALVAWEKWAYIGSFTLLALVTGMLFRFNGNFQTNALSRNSFIILWMPALVLLVFSAGFPFRLAPQTADWISFIKQFRVLARFSWPFYFVAGVYAVLTVQYVFYHAKLHISMRFAIPVIIAIAGLLDVFSYNLMVKEWAGNNSTVFYENQLPVEQQEAIKKINSEKPDFLITFPFFHVGSEMYNRAGTLKSRQLAFTFSYHTGKPLLNVEMGRTSLVETQRTLDLFVPAYARKKEDRNFLKGKVLIIDTYEGTNWREGEILKTCRQIYSCGNFSIYAGNAEEIFAPRPAEIQTDSFIKISNQVYISDSTVLYRVNEYDTVKSGMLLSHMKNYTTLNTFAAGELIPDSTYEVTFHFRTKNKTRKGGMFVVQTIDENKKVEWVEIINLARGGMEYKGNIIFEHRFKAREKNKRHEIFVYGGDEPQDDFYLIDHYLFRSPAQNVYITGTDTLLNNYPVLNK